MTKKLTSKQLKAQAAKQELIALSRDAKAAREKLIEQASTTEQALYAASLTINDLLMKFHENQTGQTEFKTFRQWQEDGYSVKKGESAFRIWGKPVKTKKTVEADNVQTGEAGEIEQEYSHFPMCCLFHRGQVDAIDTANDTQNERAA